MGVAGSTDGRSQSDEQTDGVSVEEIGAGRRRVTNERLACWVFVGYLAVGLVVLLRIGSYRWFFGDEWDFLAGRSATDLGDLFRPHNQHWSTIPILAFRALYAGFGLRTYVPYQLVVVLLHLTTCGLVRWVMRRAGVGPWIATVVAATLVLFGPGQEDIVWAFQIGFVGSIVLGLSQLLLSDHDGRIDRRDWLGLGAGLLALMCSGVAPALVLATGIAVLVRRGWRPAAFHTVPLGIVFGVWFVTTGAGQPQSALGATASPAFTVGDYAHWMRTAIEGLLEGLGHFTLLAVGLAVLFVVGWTLAWLDDDRPTFRRRAALPGALLIGWLVLTSATSVQRFSFGADEASASRFLAVAAAMCLPAFGFAADGVVRRWPRMTPVVLALFLVPIPWNVAVFGDQSSILYRPAYYQQRQTDLVALAESPFSAQVPAWVQPEPSFLGLANVNAGFLLEAKRDGKLPPPGPQQFGDASRFAVQFGVALLSGPRPRGTSCSTHTAPLTLEPKVGDHWVLLTPVKISLGKDHRRGGLPVTFTPSPQSEIVAVTMPNLELYLEPAAGSSFAICT